MPNLRTWLPALVCAAAAASLPAQGPEAERGEAPRAVKIGVVDLMRAIDQYAVAKRERERLQALSQQFNDELEALGKKIDEARGQLTLLKPGSVAHEEKEFELRALARTREDRASLRNRQFEREFDLWELAVYEDLDYAIAQIAKDRGVAIVLRVQSTIEPPTVGDRDLGAQQRARLTQYRQRTVWYTGEEVDLTPALIKYLQVFDPRAERKKAAEAAAPKAPADRVDPAKTDAGKGGGGGQ